MNKDKLALFFYTAFLICVPFFTIGQFYLYDLQQFTTEDGLANFNLNHIYKSQKRDFMDK